MNTYTLKKKQAVPIVTILKGSLLVFLFFLPYFSTWKGLARDWYENSTFSYGALIPLIFCYLIWIQRRTLQTLPIVPSTVGFLSLFVAISIGVLGKALGDSFTIRLSIVLTLAGTVHCLSGKEFLRVLRFPLAFLAFMVPFPYVFVKEVAYYLRFFNAAIADWFLRTIGIPVFREAYFLHLPNITLEVADLCSGISSVFALFALGTLYAYFLPIRSTMKILVVCSTIPFAVLVNLLRIILTSALAYFIGPQVLNFLVHEFTGMITFFIALGLFVSLGEYLHRKYIGLDKRNRSTTWLTPRESIFSETIQSSGAGAGYKKMAFLFACAMFILAHFSFSRLDNPKRIGLKSQLETLSQRLGPFSISNRSWPHPYRDRNAEYELSRMYEAEQQGLLEFYVGYASQQGDDNRLSSPRLKFVYGWNDLWAEAAKVEVDESRFIDGMWMLTQNGTQKRLVLYWYQTDGDTFGNEMSYRIARVKQLLLTGQSNAAIIRIAVPVGEDEDVEQGKKKAAEFVRHLYPEIAKLLPI